MRGARAVRRPIGIALLLLLAAAVTWLALGGPSGGPWGRTPGFALRGESAAGPVTGWEFVREYPEIALETRTPWPLRHSVTVAWLLVDGALFIPSREAAEKRWVGYVLRQPEVRLRIGEQIYDARLARVDEPAMHERLLEEVSEKWPHLRSRGRQLATMWFFRVEPR